MKKYFFLLLLILMVLGVVVPANAVTLQIQNSGKFTLIPTATLTPTPTPKNLLIIPPKKLIPIITVGVATPTAGITGTVTPTPKPSPEATVTPEDTGVLSGPTGSTGTMALSTPTAAVQNPGVLNQPTNNQDAVLTVLIGIIIIVFIGSQWSKIKSWIHQKTE